MLRTPPVQILTLHIHTDGPIPGPHSLLAVTAAAHDEHGDAISSMTVNVRPLPGAGMHPAALTFWRRHPEDWLATQRASRPAAIAVSAIAAWLDAVPAAPILLTPSLAATDADGSSGDEAGLYLYWYFHKFYGGWPYRRRMSRWRGDTQLQHSSASACPLAACSTGATGFSRHQRSARPAGHGVTALSQCCRSVRTA